LDSAQLLGYACMVVTEQESIGKILMNDKAGVNPADISMVLD